MKPAPCMKCENRGCGTYHDVCPEYQDYKKYSEEYKAKKYAEKEKEYFMRQNRKSAPRPPENSVMKMHKKY